MNRDRWGEILAASARLFCEKGYRATTMGDIAGELGITKPALYYYIKTKHYLLYEICKSAVQQLMEGVRKINESEVSPEEKLHDLIYRHVLEQAVEEKAFKEIDVPMVVRAISGM